MSQNDRIVPLAIGNVGFAISRQIEQCPKTMMLRELVMNALEAAAQAPEGRRVVEIKGKQVPEFGDVLKLAIWNTGPGMSDAELLHICDLSASLRKDMGLEGNFGIGAKVASLPSNNIGMRYRSCREGAVSQIILGKRGGEYGKILIDIDGSPEEVVDVTDAARDEGEYSLDEDWTEVVLFGNRPDQNTVDDPYNGDPEQKRQWIASYLYHRFYHLPEGVEIYLGDEVITRDGRRPFRTIPQRAASFGRTETVEVGAGAKIHYFYDPPYDKATGHNVSISGSLTSAGSPTAIVFKGEMYDVRTGRKWAADAPAFGIPFGSKHISVHVELPNDFPVRHEPYRRFLQRSGGDQSQIAVDDFADLVFRNRPEWLLEVINSLGPKTSASTDDLRKELQELLDELRLKAQSPRLAITGIELVDEGGSRGATPGRKSTSGGGGGGSGGGVGGESRRKAFNPTDFMFNPAGAKRANLTKNMEQAPEIIQLRDDDDIAEKELTGKAARYYRETNQLFVNMKYSSVGAAQEILERRYATYEDLQTVRDLAREWAERTITERVGRAVIYAHAKQLIREWTLDDVRKALEPESLSLAADGWRDLIINAHQSLSRRLGGPSARTKDVAEGFLDLSA